MSGKVTSKTPIPQAKQKAVEKKRGKDKKPRVESKIKTGVLVNGNEFILFVKATVETYPFLKHANECLLLVEESSKKNPHDVGEEEYQGLKKPVERFKKLLIYHGKEMHPMPRKRATDALNIMEEEIKRLETVLAD